MKKFPYHISSEFLNDYIPLFAENGSEKDKQNIPVVFFNKINNLLLDFASKKDLKEDYEIFKSKDGVNLSYKIVEMDIVNNFTSYMETGHHYQLAIADIPYSLNIAKWDTPEWKEFKFLEGFILNVIYNFINNFFRSQD